MGQKIEHRSTRNIKIAFFLNLAFSIIELIGGIWTNSMAILSDALHDLGDSLSLGVSWFLDRKSKQKGDDKYSFGYQRFSLLAALISSVVLIAGSLFILSEIIPRLITPQKSNAEGMFVFALIGIIVNGIAVIRLKGGKSLNEQLVSWHLLEDVLGWVAVLIVSIVLFFWDIRILDPILSGLIILYVLVNVVRNLRKTLNIFLQGVPKNVNISRIKVEILTINKISDVHHTHVWSLDGEENVLSVHIVVERLDSLNELVEIKGQVKKILRKMPIEHVTLEIEFEDESCYMTEINENP